MYISIISTCLWKVEALNPSNFYIGVARVIIFVRISVLHQLAPVNYSKNSGKQHLYSKTTLIFPCPLSGAGNPKSPLLPVSYNLIPFTPGTTPFPFFSNLTKVRKTFASVINSSAYANG